MQSSSTAIRTIILDLGGVYFTDGAGAFVKKMEKLHGLTKDEIIAVIGGEWGNKYRTSEVTPQEFWSHAKATWHIDLTEQELSKLWLQEYVPIQETVKLVRALRAQGYELLFLSDNAPDRIDYLESSYHFIADFDGGIFSHIVRARKPHDKMYEAVLGLTDSAPEQCVYVDDKQHLLEPAKKRGVHVIAFTSAEQLKSDLKKLGVTV